MAALEDWLVRLVGFNPDADDSDEPEDDLKYDSDDYAEEESKKVTKYRKKETVYEPETAPEDYMTSSKKKNSGKTGSKRRERNEDPRQKVNVIEVSGFEDGKYAVDCLKDEMVVVLNFEKTDRSMAQDVINYMAGAAYAMGAEIQMISEVVLLCTMGDVVQN